MSRFRFAIAAALMKNVGLPGLCRPGERIRPGYYSMMLVPHTGINAAAGRLFRRPLTAFAAGVVGHALLDLVPHKDISAHKAEGFMVFLMLGLVGSSCGWRSPAFWCAMGGVLPDVEQVLPWTDPARGRRRWFPTHSRRFHSVSIPGAEEYRTSLLLQSAVSMAMLLLAISSCKRRGS